MNLPKEVPLKHRFLDRGVHQITKVARQLRKKIQKINSKIWKYVI